MRVTYLDFLAAAEINGAHPGGLSLTKSILANERLAEKDRVLDVGCGIGQTATYIASVYGCDVTACDNHKSMVQKASNNLKSMGLPVKVVEASAENLPFKDQTFNYVLSESVTSFTNIGKSLREYKRVLAEDGEFIAIEMTRISPMTQTEIEEIEDFYQVKSLLSEEEWQDAFKQAGFVNVEMIGSALAEEHKDDVEHGAEFDLFQLGQEYVDVYFKHIDLTEKYGGQLGYCVFKCW
ncbi:class I SAM-dependent methyltransferase [Ferdinandcohnia quinoae]|uniref:Class I SAM-dependent methyltransferase n=1 Tax=Fredinandcohnia quinoae TaxID=2918902 RepID=A0AAW5DUL9_9BACI|nr:class I SAM-dependent methyltransferase [Fredinandcohnia sp. SECRCQ15]MCH1624330.1 class I SAM-dependent methyltransferase [Fredinandcohnia sp. SECRCQ15]